MTDWRVLNTRGRCFARAHYRRLRRGGVDRRTSRLIVTGMVLGIEMADRFGPYTQPDPTDWPDRGLTPGIRVL